MPSLAKHIEDLFYCKAKNLDQEGMIERIKHDLEGLKSKKFESLILGCTHYPLIDELIKNELGLKTINPAKAVAQQAKRLLELVDSPKDADGHYQFKHIYDDFWLEKNISELELLLL